MNCQVPSCPDADGATWICADSNMRYCNVHKHPHGEPPHRFRKVKTRRLNKNSAPIAAVLISS